MSGLARQHWPGPAAPPVVLLHSLGEDRSSWAVVAAELAADRPVVALDLPGHGATFRRSRNSVREATGRTGASGTRPAYSFELLRDEVSTAIAALGLDQVSILGHSLGGMLGYLIAAQQPSWLHRLVLEEAPPPLPVEPPRPTPERPDTDVGFDWAVLSALYQQRNEPDPSWWDSLASIEVPTLIIAGGADSHVDQRELARMAEQIPDCRLTPIGGGHNVHATLPASFTTVVREFLAEHDAGPKP